MKREGSVPNRERVAIICGAGIVSGKEIMALELGQGLRNRGMEVRYVTSCWGNGEFARRTQALEFPTQRMRLGFISITLRPGPLKMTTHQAIFWPSLLVSYAKFIREFNPARVIHTNWHHALLLLPLLNVRRDIYWTHEVMPDRALYRHVFRRIAKRVSSFVAVSQASAHGLARLGVDPDRIRTIYNGVSDPLNGGVALRNNQQRLGIVGQIGRWKGHEILLNAFMRISSEFPEAQIHIFGRGTKEYEQLLRTLVSKAGISNRVVFQGFVSNAGDIYRGIDICVVPSLFEDPLPTSAIEASLAGVPVVASNRGGLPEIVEEGHTGFLFEPGRDDLLAAKLKFLLEDADKRHEMGVNARKFAQERFSAERFVSQFEELIR
jgi:glycosyltransferase involved in cell wall biosynthesis